MRRVPFLTSGMCSVTYRPLSADRIVELAAGAGLDRVEWGQDAHVPLGDEAEARRVAEATRAAGLEVSALGSYYRAGVVTDPEEDRRVWRQVLGAARALGAPRIRVWAGNTASAAVDAAGRRRIVDGLRRCVDSAAETTTDGGTGITVATEFHDGTLTDEIVSARSMLDEVPGLRTYWQPPNGMPDEQALAGLEAVLDRVDGVHVFSWWPTPRERWPLEHREALWRRALATVAATGRRIDTSLEFVPGDDPAVLSREAATLRRYLLDVSAGDDAGRPA
ncbi:sugar phosphate isomerase/epimerase family protein [Streptosporangium sp. NPDC050855]|uniref:sugar phosphate isomerase/epimerase family protein n=1 Tax=Streptosporangium sp. NPDC050855 TaxID=3366194 RepID=UPI0037B52146